MQVIGSLLLINAFCVVEVVEIMNPMVFSLLTPLNGRSANQAIFSLTQQS
jgi:hypothetical protein